MLGEKAVTRPLCFENYDTLKITLPVTEIGRTLTRKTSKR